jgi:hypothetical protein
MTEDEDFIEKAVRMENGLVFQTVKGKLVLDDDTPRIGFSSRCRAVSARLKQIDESGIEKGW